MSTVPGPYVPPEGYQVPPAYGQYAPPFEPGVYDPLVPAPGSRFDGWWALVLATFRRSAWMLILIFALTSALPSLVLAIAGTATGAVLELNPMTIDQESGSVTWDQGVIAGLIGAGVIFLFVTTFLNALGWGAAIHAVLQSAAGHSVSIGAAFRAGFRRVLPMWGWSVLSIVVIAIGAVLCLVPGLYLALALSMFSFAVMFERGTNQFARSFRLVHNNFGQAIGRVALLFGMYIVVSFVASCIVGVITGLLGVSTMSALDPSSGSAVGVGLGVQIVSSVIQEAIALPLLSFVLVGLMITYTQLRSNEAPLSTPQLWAEAHA